MPHLSPETLARLVDESGTETEREHLDACSECAAELEALRRQTSILGSLPPPPVPNALRARVEVAARPAVRRERFARRGLGAAAAIAIFAAGALVGAGLDDPEASPPTASAVDRRAADPALELERAEERYLRALARWSTEGENPRDPISRLAAIESVLETARAARARAPGDPLFDGVYRAAHVQRNAILSRVDLAQEEGWF
ncbi:MAG: hypothetical protein R3199_08245 [Gemmatimonadota bacterium]|nr:hypothetical protein [Gemmatimonadota bacterium]